MKLTCLIVDDEPIARKGLTEYVNDVPFLTLAEVCESAAKADNILQHQPVDLMLLDIHMPGITGIEFLKSLQNPPLVIITSAYPDYALEGYALDVIDYLVKPIVFERFQKAVQKAFDYHSLKAAATPSPDYFFIKCDRMFEKVQYRDVLYIEAMQNYCIVHTPVRKFITYITLSTLEARLPETKFLRIHKSYIAALEKITALDGNDITIGSVQLPVSRSLKTGVMKKVLGNNVLKR